MLTSAIIENFETYVDDTTELSSSQELSLANKIYQKIWNSHDWEFSKKEKTGSVSGTEISLPDDFSNLVENYNYTDNSTAEEIGARPIYVFVNGVPFLAVNWSDRRRYENNSNVCYLDIVNNKIIFPVSVSGNYSFDYKFFPVDLTLETSPVFPANFHHILYHGMAVDDMIIQLFDRARSYADYNEANYQSYLGQMQMWNSKLLNY